MGCGMETDEKVIITTHGEKRARKRVGLPRDAVEGAALKAFKSGIKHSETSGSLKRYIDSLYLRERTANNIRIWAEKVWIFSDDRLVTVLPLPPKFRRIVREMGRKERA